MTWSSSVPLKRPWSCRLRPACNGTASRDKKLFDPLLDDLDCVSVVKEAMELQVEACMKEEDKVAAATITQALSAIGKEILKAKRASLANDTFEMLMFMRGSKHYVMILF